MYTCDKTATKASPSGAKTDLFAGARKCPSEFEVSTDPARNGCDRAPEVGTLGNAMSEWGSLPLTLL